MEQNLVSDEELIERINKVLQESKHDKKGQAVGNRQQSAYGDRYHEVYENTELRNTHSSPGEVVNFTPEKNLELENHYLSLQLQAEKNRSKELQSKFKLFESSVKYFERLNGQLETIKRAVDEDCFDIEKGDIGLKTSLEAMQKIRPKTIHTATSGMMSPTTQQDEKGCGVENFSEPHTDESGNNPIRNNTDDKDEVAFRDAEDFKQLDQGMEIVKDENGIDYEAEKVFITKKEKRCLEDIGNLASRTRTPLDDKHQKFFERDRRRFANSIVMPEIQEVDKAETVPPEIISKTKETPVNITSTELDGLRSYLLQLKELIARRETAWARTTERDYNQRVEITRFKNEVSHLRMLCEKRQRDVKERDQIIASKEEEIRELQKRIQGLRSAIMKLEKKDDKLMDTIDGMTNEVLENSHIVQRSYNAMKRQSMINRTNAMSSMNITPSKQLSNLMQTPPPSSKEAIKKSKILPDKTPRGKSRVTEPVSNDEDGKSWMDKSKAKTGLKDKSKTRHRNESLVTKTRETFDKVDEKMQRVEEMLHNEALRGARKTISRGKPIKNDVKTIIKNQAYDKSMDYIPANAKKITPSNSTIRQEMLTAMTGIGGNSPLGIRSGNFADAKKGHATAAVIANALLAARNANFFNY